MDKLTNMQKSSRNKAILTSIGMKILRKYIENSEGNQFDQEIKRLHFKKSNYLTKLYEYFALEKYKEQNVLNQDMIEKFEEIKKHSYRDKDYHYMKVTSLASCITYIIAHKNKDRQYNEIDLHWLQNTRNELKECLESLRNNQNPEPKNNKRNNEDDSLNENNIKKSKKIQTASFIIIDSDSEIEEMVLPSTSLQTQIENQSFIADLNTENFEVSEAEEIIEDEINENLEIMNSNEVNENYIKQTEDLIKILDYNLINDFPQENIMLEKASPTTMDNTLSQHIKK